MDNDKNKNEKTKNEFIFNFIKNINDIKTKSLEIKNTHYVNNINKDLLKEKDKKIEDLQKQCEELKKKLEIKEDNDLLKYKNKNIIDDNFNTSTNFPIKNEIKKTWEELALVSILDTFIDFESEPEKIFHLICEIILIMDKLINDLCKEIYEKVSLSLNIPVNDTKFINDIEKISRPLIKENLNKIFIQTESKPFFEKFIYLFQSSLKNNNIFNYIQKDKEILEQIIHSEELAQMIKKIKEILLYTKFNDQKLYFKIEPDIRKRNIEKININNINDKKKYLIINDNNLINFPAIVILNPPVMKNGFPLNNNFKPILMILNDNYNNDSKINYINKPYQIYANSFTIFDNNTKNENSNMNIVNIYKDKNISLPATINNEVREKNKIKLKFELNSSLGFNNINNESENEKSKRSYNENYNINYFNNTNNKNKTLNKNSIYNLQNSNHKNNNNINNKIYKQHKPYTEHYYKINNNSLLTKKQQNKEIFYDSLLQSEYINSPRNLSNNSLNHEPEQDEDDQDQIINISINNKEIKGMNAFNFNSNLNNNNTLYNNKYLDNKRNSLNNKKYLNLNISKGKINTNQRKIKKNVNNNSNKNIYKNNINNDNEKYVYNINNKDICSTEINPCNNNNNYNYENSCLKKYRTVKEMNKGKKVKNEEKFLFSLNNGNNQEIVGKQNLYKENGKKYINNPKKDIDIFKEHLKIRKKKLQNNKLNNNMYNNYNSHKFEKNSSYKNKLNMLYTNEYRSIQHENHSNNKPLNYSPVDSNTIFITSKNTNNRNSKKLYPKEHSYNNTNVRKRSRINNYNNNSNNISVTKPQAQISSSSTILKNSNINTGFKIKNVNINYFNIMQPNELIFNQQRTNRSKSRPNISNIYNNNYQINCSNSKNIKNKKNNNIKTNKFSNITKSDNSLFLMTDLIDVKKLKENMRKDKKCLITKVQNFRKHNESCLSNDIRRPKMYSNQINKIRITKQSIRLIDRNTLNSFDRNKSSIPKNKNFIANFSNSNSKLISYIKIPNKSNINNNKQKNVNLTNREKIINKKNNSKSIIDIKGYKSHIIGENNKNINNDNNIQYKQNNNVNNRNNLMNYNYS